MLANVDAHPRGGGTRSDKRETRLTIGLLVIAGLARLPFIWRGFGGHPDEWLVVRSGLDLWLHGIYVPSRGPGYLLDEVIMGGLAWLGGSPACAIAAIFASLATLAYLRGLARLSGVRDSFWLVLAFSFEPWFWASGTHDLDYVWGTGALVAALYYVERRQFILAGLCCSIGFGFRPSSLLWIVPVFLRVLWIERTWQGAARFGVSMAIPALVPTLMFIVRLLAPTSVASADIGGQIWEITKFIQYPLSTSLLAAYHIVELVGQIPAALLIGAAFIVNRHQLSELFRTQSWVWTYVLIFAFLLIPFMSLSEKPEYMLPALPGLFIILGYCISYRWWVAIMAAFLFNAFVSFGFGHAAPGGVRIEAAGVSLRPGPLLWYAGRAQAANDLVSQTGATLLRRAQVVRADSATDHLDDLYVSSLLRRGPRAQARIDCPLLAAAVSYSDGRPSEIRASLRLRLTPPATYPLLICCGSISGVGLSGMPPAGDDELKEAIRRFCAKSRSEEARETTQQRE